MRHVLEWSLWVLFIGAFVLFAGDPDIADAIMFRIRVC